MILVFGGTTEGKRVAKALNRTGEKFIYSTKTQVNSFDLSAQTTIHGAMDAVELNYFCRQENIQYIINAAHPFATELHRNIHEVANKLNIPVIRFERAYPARQQHPLINYLDSFPSACQFFKKLPRTPILALTGVQTIAKLKPLWKEKEVWFRILNRASGFKIVEEQQFPKERIVARPPQITQPEIEALIQQTRAQYIITKESGESGYLPEKMAAALKTNCHLLIIKRPPLPENWQYINNEKQLTEALAKNRSTPGTLKSGFTTGTCATVAAVAALNYLLTKEKNSRVEVELPRGETITYPIHHIQKVGDWCQASVIKDAGDDPDVTNGLEIGCRLKTTTTSSTQFSFLKGEGVGEVTLPGIGIPVGEPAINPAPRKMIVKNLSHLLHLHNCSNMALEIMPFIPQGAAIANKTFNPRLGIKGGISIIGTTGIVKPFSAGAFIDTIKKTVQVAVENNLTHLFINSGGRSEKQVQSLFPENCAMAFIQYGNFIGECLAIINQHPQIKKVTLAAMTGKAAKLAQGHLDTHSHKVTVSFTQLSELAQQHDYPNTTITAIAKASMVKQIEEFIPFSSSEPFYTTLAKRCYEHCQPLIPSKTLQIILLNTRGNHIIL